MKMMGFVVALGVLYWAMASYAQSVMAKSEPCLEADAPVAFSATAGNEPDAVERIHARWTDTGIYQTVSSSMSETPDAGSVCVG